MHNIANILLYELAKKSHLPVGKQTNNFLINEIVEGWNKQIYITPGTAIKLRKPLPQKNYKM